YREREVGFALKQTGAKVFIVPPVWRDYDYADLGRRVTADLPNPPQIIALADVPRGDPATLPPPPAGLSADEAAVYAALTPEPLHVDDLAAATALAPSNVLAALLGLELRDLAQSLPGKQYRLRG
ncbi:MAG TPA: hypothetical protein VJT67_01085, partial [Longimicrobiaceae bacterium]|nr:hypothetical protein [Longimicrobiaceae bacterium]